MTLLGCSSSQQQAVVIDIPCIRMIIEYREVVIHYLLGKNKSLYRILREGGRSRNRFFRLFRYL